MQAITIVTLIDGQSCFDWAEISATESVLDQAIAWLNANREYYDDIISILPGHIEPLWAI